MPLDQGKIWSNNNAFAAHPDTAAKPLGCYLWASGVMVATLVLEASAARRKSSSLFLPTIKESI